MFNQRNVTEFAREELVSKIWGSQISEKESMWELKAFVNFGKTIEPGAILFSQREILKFRGLANLFKKKGVALKRKPEGYLAFIPQEALPQEYMNEEEAGAYMRGAFLVSGYLSLGKQGYHLEIISSDKSDDLFQTATRLTGVDFKSYERRGRQVFYLKNLDTIIHFFVVIGAVDTALFIHDTALRRQVRSQTQVLVNYDIANTYRSFQAASRQRVIFEKLVEDGELYRLPFALKEMVEARLKYPEYTLEELARELNLTRSAVNHRLRRLIRWKSGQG